MHKLRIVILATIGLCLFAFPAAGGDFDGSKPMLCAPIDIAECALGKGCQRVTAESVGLPQFLRIDFKQRSISGKLVDGTTKSVSIEMKKRQDGNLILQGVQNGRGWSMVIPEDTGKMTLSVAGNNVGFFVSGACTIP